MRRTRAAAWKLQTKCCRVPIYFSIGDGGLDDGYFYHCGGCHRWLPLLRPEAVVSAARPPELPPKSYVRAARKSPAPPAPGAANELEPVGSEVGGVARGRRS